MSRYRRIRAPPRRSARARGHRDAGWIPDLRRAGFPTMHGKRRPWGLPSVSGRWRPEGPVQEVRATGMAPGAFRPEHAANGRRWIGTMHAAFRPRLNCVTKNRRSSPASLRLPRYLAAWFRHPTRPHHCCRFLRPPSAVLAGYRHRSPYGWSIPLRRTNPTRRRWSLRSFRTAQCSLWSGCPSLSHPTRPR